MELLVRLIGARRAIEVGTFTGYSALVTARGLGPGGLLIACDVNPETTAIGRRYWEQAGVGDRIDLRIAPAVDTLEALLAAGEAGTFDFGFIDADKGGYDSYYERLLLLLRPGGLLCIDNVLWGGRVVDQRDHRDQLALQAPLDRRLVLLMEYSKTLAETLFGKTNRQLRQVTQ